MKIVLFLGYSESGKTFALTSISRALKAKGKKIGTIKRIHDRNFSIDAKGKDTWLHAASGASIVVGFAPKEISIIRKERDTSEVSLKEILGIFQQSKVDYLLVEGLHKKFEKVRGVKRIICARSKTEALSLAKIHTGKILFTTGKFAKGSLRREIGSIPILSFPRDNAKALRLIDSG